MPAATSCGIHLSNLSKEPEIPIKKIITADVIYAATASLSEICGNSVTNKAVPGADQAVITGTLNLMDKNMPATAAPIEIPQIHEIIMALLTWACCAA